MTDPLRALPNPILEKVTPDDFIKTSPKLIQLKSNPNGILQQAARGFLARLGMATLGLSLIKLFGEQSPYDSFLENPLIEKDNLSEEDVRKLLEELYNPGAAKEILKFLQENYPELDFVTDENLLLALGWLEIQEDQNQDSVTAYNLLDLIFDKWDKEKRSELWKWLTVLHPELAERIDFENEWRILAVPTPQTWSGDFEIKEDWEYTDNPHYEDPFAVPDLSPKVFDENDKVGPAQNWQGAIRASDSAESDDKDTGSEVELETVDLARIIGKLRVAVSEASIHEKVQVRKLLTEAKELQVQEVMNGLDKNRLDAFQKELSCRFPELKPKQAVSKDVADLNASQPFIESAMNYLTDGYNQSRLVGPDDRILIDMISSGLEVFQPSDVSASDWKVVAKRCAKKWVVGDNDLEMQEFEKQTNQMALAEAIAKKINALKENGMPRVKLLSIVHRHSLVDVNALQSQYSRSIAFHALSFNNPYEVAAKMQEAYDAAYKIAKHHPNPRVKKSARTIALVTIKHATSGKEKGEEVARNIIQGSEVAYQVALNHPNPNIQKRAGTIAGISIRQGKQRSLQGEKFARAIIQAGEAAYEVVRDHANPKIRRVAGTIVVATMRQGKQGKAEGENFARDVVSASESAYSFAKRHTNPIVRKNARLIAGVAAMRAKRGRAKGEEFAAQVIEAIEAAYNEVESHPKPEVQKQAKSIVTLVASSGKQGRAKGEEFARKEIAKISGGDND